MILKIRCDFLFFFQVYSIIPSFQRITPPPPFLRTEQLPYWLCEVLEQFSPISPFTAAEGFCWSKRRYVFVVSTS